MRSAEPASEGSKLSRRKRRRMAHAQSQDQVSAESSLTGQSIHQPEASSAQARSIGFQHSARCLVLSPFVDLTAVWADALRAVSPVPPTANSALDFFPLPYLLDTVSDAVTPTPGCAHQDRVRVDGKVHRYLHNLLRIREFCRARLFDVSLDNRPLTIAEWRTALWGQYLAKSSVRNGAEGADARRAKRRLEERNGIAALCHKVADMDSYNAHVVVEFRGLAVDLNMIAQDPSIRADLLWESHEVNFRAELLALDTLRVQKKDWMEINRWERKMLVSGVGGSSSSAA
ncbi:hypothetical protein DICSQDRAFT_171926 [Dichomitus squalens LYAD-421 SS1]|uniref:Uncharacterized protein n=1 Tax=Dichomitus squalens (strain LYAD-421) TaxID=732165 RepID=R7STW9_DICSQ|nr:uncharacterized protein DICSQDRAFT_171926 [Dichomitus squalens LYAD-421 SS1]EJF59526.1 hypothetical protein DICSQDRAFT_171926 [Dichomitus squalens LYAD-421 SS1]